MTVDDHARIVFDGLGGKIDYAWDEWRPLVVLTLAAGSTGAMALVRDAYNPEIVWIETYCPGRLPKVSLMRLALRVLARMGFEIVAADISRSDHPDVSARALRFMGFEEIGEGRLFAARLVANQRGNDERLS